MLGRLPTSLNINGKDYPIRTDYRVALTVFQGYNEPDYSEDEKTQIAIECLLEHPEELSENDVIEASKQVAYFLSGGEAYEEDNGHEKIGKTAPQLFDWEQDEQLIFSAVNKVAGKEVRALDYLHWWTFLGYFKDRGECFLNSIINIRDKLNKHQQLTKDEKEFYRMNQSMIDLKKRLTAEEKAQEDYYNDLLKQYGC